MTLAGASDAVGLCIQRRRLTILHVLTVVSITTLDASYTCRQLTSTLDLSATTIDA